MRILAVALVLCLPCAAYAEGQTQQSAQTQQAITTPLTLREAVSRALDNYPAVRAALANIQVSAAGVDLARTTYLPRADILWQMNRATRNNVFGLVLPQPIVAGISGPAGLEEGTTVWGSATGLLVNWEPFDFGQRRASVYSAQSALERATAAANVTELQVATAAADAFLGIVAAEQTLRAASASVERARVFHEVVSARVQAGLRPGVDAERARAELALAETQRIVAEQNLAIARVALAQYIGRDPAAFSVSPGMLLQLPSVGPSDTPPPTPSAGTQAPLDSHPLVREQTAAVEESRARLRLLERSYFPRFNFLFNTYARGTGALTNGAVKNGLGGLKPEVSNWAMGLNVTFPLLDRPVIGARARGERQRQLAETARYDRLLDDLNAQFGRGQALFEGANRAAANTPFQLAAARSTHQQATARYQSGLTGIVEVADALRLLTQSEIDDTIAKLNVWRGLLLVATAQGNLDPFLARVQP